MILIFLEQPIFDIQRKLLIAQSKAFKAENQNESLSGPQSFFGALQFPSSQLQILGDIAEDGKCLIKTMNATISYTVDKGELYGDLYQLQVLTLYQVSTYGINRNLISRINNEQGFPGHVLLHYKSGGKLLASMIHWIQLNNIKTNEKMLFKVAERQYGLEQANLMKMKYFQLNSIQQNQYLRKNAIQIVQNHAPCVESYKI